MKMTPIKKILIGLAAICVAVTMITTNNIASVMMIKANQNMKAQQGSAQTNQQNVVADQNVNNGAVNNNGGTVADQTVSNGTVADQSAGASTATGDTAGANTATDNNAGASKGDAATGNNAGNAGDKGNAGGTASSKKPSTYAEIAEYYKTSMNKAKTQSKSVVRVKDGAINYKNKVVAGNLSSVAESLMGMFMAKDAASIEAKNEEWEASKLPPENTNCNLTANGIKEASCVEKGDYYIITIVAKDAKNPKAGSDGVGSICSVIQEETITGSISSVPGLSLSNISLDYENVKVVATIEKATGNMVALSLDAPCYLSLDAKVPLLGSIDDACVGIEVISEYKMTY